MCIPMLSVYACNPIFLYVYVMDVLTLFILMYVYALHVTVCAFVLPHVIRINTTECHH